MKRLLPLVFVFLTLLPCLAQKRATNWYLGRNAGISFNNNSAEVLGNGAQDAYEACASISDLNGNLLFYTDGLTVWNKEHTVMSNGTDISGNRSATQGALIIPKPASKNLFYLLTIDDSINNTFNLKYSIIDISQEDGLGAVTSTKNVVLLNGVSERMAATYSHGGLGVWVVVRDADAPKFYSFLIDANGISTTPVTTTVGSSTSNSIGVQAGQMKFSPDGAYLAWACRTDRFVELIRFNKVDGTFLNWNKKIVFHQTNELPYGVEFSADASRLYVSLGYFGVYQYDMSMAVNEALLRSSGTKVSNVGASGFGLQLAPNGKIYMATYSPNIHVINSPSSPPSQVDFQMSALTFGTGKFSRDGMPNFVSNYFIEKRIVSSDSCIGDSTSFAYLMELGDSVEWNFGDIASNNNTSSQTTPKHVFSSAGRYTVRLVVYTGEGTDTIFHQVTIHNIPNFNLGSDTTVCFGSNYLLNPGIAGATYLWQDGKTTPVFAVKSSGVFHVRVDYRSCVSYDTVAIQVDAPSVKLIANSELHCVNNNAFNFTIEQQDRVAQIHWDFGDGTGSELRQVTHSYTVAGSYLVELETINENGCKSEASYNLEVFDIVPAILSVNQTEQCFEQNSFEVSTPQSGNPDLQNYCIVFSDGKKFTNESATYSFPIEGTKNVKLITTSLNGCKDTVGAKLRVYAQPTASFEIDSSAYCLNSNAITLVSTSNSLNGGISSSKFFSDGQSVLGEDASYSYSAPGAYAISLEITDIKGCKSSQTQFVNIYPDPVVQFSLGMEGNCIGTSPIKLENESRIDQGSLASYTWDFGDGTSSTSFEPIKQYFDAKSYTIALTAVSDKGCKKTTSLPVVTYEAPKASFTTVNFEPCLNENRIDLDNTSAINSTDVLSYVWELDGKVFTQENLLNYSFTNTGPQFVTLTVTSDKGCSDQYQTSFMILPSPQVNFVVDEPMQCQEQNRFVALNTSVNEESPAVNLLWRLEDGRTFTGSLVEFSFTNAGIYALELELTNQLGCKSVAKTNVQVHPQPIAAFDVDDVCRSEAANFINQSSVSEGSLSSYLWDFGDNLSSNSSSPSHQYSLPGEYAVYLEVSSDKGCSNFIVNKIRVNEEPVAEYTYKKYGYKTELNETVYEFNCMEEDPNASVSWFVNGVKMATGKRAFLSFNDTGHFAVTMTVSTGFGCPGTAEKKIFVAPPFELYMPTAFTPNGDGRNDILLPTGSNYIQEYSMIILNRWGSLMFQSTDPYSGWDGTFRSEAVQGGVYVYIIKVKDIEGVEWEYQGSVLVIH